MWESRLVPAYQAVTGERFVFKNQKTNTLHIPVANDNDTAFYIWICAGESF